jgi:hypothetical protein
VVTILKRDVILLFVFVFLDQVTTYFGVFHLKLEERNPIVNFIFQVFGEYGIFLAFLYQFLGCLALFIFFRFLRIKIFKVDFQTEYMFFLLPLSGAINNIYVINLLIY